MLRRIFIYQVNSILHCFNNNGFTIFQCLQRHLFSWQFLYLLINFNFYFICQCF